ncbi:hypothetical protein [Curtobacterium sp. ISL-83]|uniref:hypothetical protein n=1 Tax=Curtobacterium sp. ISL-83 TaxID=2819145 RepID=UPI001BEAAFE0|nr:hypothetical protein [Curtobacterium sp. ISL-83]MBT2502433.1 hypothetical protein [Curtobacterium sp. ISL-83]
MRVITVPGRGAVTAWKIVSVSAVGALLCVSLVLDQVSRTSVPGSDRAHRFESWAMTGLAMTLALGLAVGFSWLFWARRQAERREPPAGQ